MGHIWDLVYFKTRFATHVSYRSKQEYIGCHLVSHAAVICVVTKRCVTTQITAAQEISSGVLEFWSPKPLRDPKLLRHFPSLFFRYWSIWTTCDNRRCFTQQQWVGGGGAHETQSLGDHGGHGGLINPTGNNCSPLNHSLTPPETNTQQPLGVARCKTPHTNAHT